MARYFFDLTLVAETGALADNDVIAVPAELALGPSIGHPVVIESAQLYDKDDQGQDIDIIFLSADGAVGDLNAAFTAADAVASTIIGVISFLQADYLDAVDARVAFKHNLNLPLNLSGRSVWVVAVCRSGTPTYTAGGLRLRLFVSW